MKKWSILAFIIAAVCIFQPTTTFAKQQYPSKLNIDPNEAFIGTYRWYDTGAFKIEIAMEQLKQCTGSREKKLWVTLHYSPTRQMSGKMMDTSVLYSCQLANMGSFSNGQYAYGFATKYTGGRVFCGLKTENVLMFQ